jgi:hypothetical protein
MSACVLLPSDNPFVRAAEPFTRREGEFLGRGPYFSGLKGDRNAVGGLGFCRAWAPLTVRSGIGGQGFAGR